MTMKRTLITCMSNKTIWPAVSLRSALVTALLLAPLAAQHAAEPSAVFRDAVAIWSMKDTSGSGTTASHLLLSGNVTVGVELEEADRKASLTRGGDGYVTRFQGGYLTTDSTTPVRLNGKNASICLRLRDTTGSWMSPLLATAHAKDRLANVIFGNGTDLVYRWRTSPPWERVEGIPKRNDGGTADDPRGTYGFNGESNDAHDLLPYAAGKWMCSVVRVHDDGRVVVADQDQCAERGINIQSQAVSGEAFFIGSKAGKLEFLDGDIAEVLVYDRPLSEDEAKLILAGLLEKWNVNAPQSSGGQTIPTDGLVLQLDANHVQCDQQGNVTLWPDRSGRGRDMKQSLSGKMPRQVANACGRHPAIHFERGQFLQGPAVLSEGDDSFTVIGLWRRQHLNGSQVIFEQNSAVKRAGARAALLTQGQVAASDSGWMRNRHFAEGVLPISAPLDWCGRTAWHDVIVRFADTVVELYVDGVLIDEEWPHGALYQFCSPFLIGAGYSDDGRQTGGFTGEIDHVALWDRALSREEIIALSGGAEQVARRDLEILGKPQQSIQYWKPRGKAYAGDCMVTCKDGEFHVFYLYDRLHHEAKWGLGAHQYGHFSSRDLKRWTHHPLAVPLEQQWECAMGTGNVIYNEKDRRWYAFYTDCGSRIQFFDKPQRGAWLFRAVSDDGIHFHKDFKPVQPGFDSDIFFVPETGLFHLIAEGGRTHVQSADLQAWTRVADSEFRKTAERNNLSVICPDTLAWNGWYYFTAGSSHIYKSRKPLGPWEEIPKNIFDGLFFSKMHAFKDGRALAAGWVANPGWGGNIVVRELVQTPEGELGLKFVPEMIPATGDPLPIAVTQKVGKVTCEAKSLRIQSASALAYAAIDGVPRNVRIRARVIPSSGQGTFGLCVSGDGDYASGSELSFRPAEQHVQFGHPRGGKLDEKRPVSLVMDGDTGAMPPMTGLDRAFTLDIIVKDRIVDVCIDNRRTFIARRKDVGGNRLFFFAENGGVDFEQVEILPLAEE
jgi:hypothetical protein